MKGAGQQPFKKESNARRWWWGRLSASLVAAFESAIDKIRGSNGETFDE